MSEDSDQEQKVITRRSVLTHLVAGGIGWVLTGLLNPFRRALNAILSDTRFGREAKVTFGYAETDDGRYMLQVVNHGEETAENVTAHLGFEEKITDATIQQHVNTPPNPDTNIEILDGGIAKLDIEHVRREFLEHVNPIIIYFSVEEGTESDVAWRMQDQSDGDMFLAYRYSWTFLGERYYESTSHHIADTD